jgi:hypothetical protein
MGRPGTLRSFSASSRRQDGSPTPATQGLVWSPRASSATKITAGSVLRVLSRPHPTASAGNGGRGEDETIKRPGTS